MCHRWIIINPHRRYGPMDKASVYGTEDSRFDPWFRHFSQYNFSLLEESISFSNKAILWKRATTSGLLSTIRRQPNPKLMDPFILLI